MHGKTTKDMTEGTHVQRKKILHYQDKTSLRKLNLSYHLQSTLFNTLYTGKEQDSSLYKEKVLFKINKKHGTRITATL